MRVMCNSERRVFFFVVYQNSYLGQPPDTTCAKTGCGSLGSVIRWLLR